MELETHKQLRSFMICVIVFAFGCVLAFGGCSSATRTEARMLDSSVEFGGGLYLQEDKPNWD